MKPVTIVANSAAEALAEVHRQLGPQAIVLNVKKTAAPGFSRIWKKPQIELLATVPGPPQGQPKKRDLDDLAEKVNELKQRLARPVPSANRIKAAYAARPIQSPSPEALIPIPTAQTAGDIDICRILENLGILPLHAQWLVDQVRMNSESSSERNLREEFGAIQDFLLARWNRLAAENHKPDVGTRILVGPPGVGKTTCICKWLTQEVLLQNRQARVWRLDGHMANTAEFLSIHGEILNVPVERVWTPGPWQEPVQFVDFPGIAVNEAEAIAALAVQIDELQPAEVYLVLNAAYDLTHLMAHIRAFRGLPLTGLILSHVDEENRWSKFWNLLLSSSLPVLYFSGGQNIPGHFAPSSPQSLFDVTTEASDSESRGISR